MKNLRKLIVILMIVSAAQLQKVNAQSECDNTAEVESTVLFAYNTTTELMYHSTLRSVNTNNSLASAEELNSSNTQSVVDELLAEQQNLLESNLKDLDAALTVDTEENLQVENWMLTPDNWIVTK